jgi:uncharacterized Zn finger protein
MSSREKIEGRLAAAALNGGASNVIAKGDDHYLVVGRAGTRYTVFAPSLERMLCDCPSGIHGGICWHQAAVYLKKVADSAISPQPSARADLDVREIEEAICS